MTRRIATAVGLVAGLWLGGVAFAQDAQPETPPAPKADEPKADKPTPNAPKSDTPESAAPPERPAPEPTPPETAPPETADEPLPSLDDLLGIDEDDRPSDGDAPVTPIEPADPAAEDLARKLSGEELPQEIEAAVSLMGDVANRLEESLDTGLATQRIQEDIVRRLDQVIEAAQQQQQQSSSSSSSGDPSGQPNQQPPQPEGGSESQQSSDGDNQGEATPPGRQDGELNPRLTPTRAAWGALPERTRDALLQGSSEKFSAMYERLTEAYYRRLAEESDR